jgi:hypothetical protein
MKMAMRDSESCKGRLSITSIRSLGLTDFKVMKFAVTESSDDDCDVLAKTLVSEITSLHIMNSRKTVFIASSHTPKFQ